MVEAKKRAFADRAAYLGDPEFVRVPTEALLSKSYAERRRAGIDMNRAAAGVPAGEVHHDTTYFCIADRQGNGISFIQSVFHGFGCGVVAEGTGILFNNRMTGFSLDPTSPNRLQPGKRTAHTLNAYLITRGDQLAWVGGTPGGDVQVQSNLQVICNVIDYGLNPQQAIEAPRWQHGPAVPSSGFDSGILQIEERISPSVREDLARRGHRVEAIGPWAHSSHYQLIAVDASGSYHVGSDPRCDGHAAGY
jgi:gamma-glutamyltranspeptidase/glutathione hydrolase